MARIVLTDLLSPQDNLLLLEISSVFFVYQNQVEKISDREPIVYGIIRRCQIGWYSLQIQSYRNLLSLHGCSVHNLVLGQSLRLSEDVGIGIPPLDGRCRLARPRRSDRRGRHALPGRFSPYDRQLHVLDFDPNQEEVDLAQDDVGEVVASAFVFELDVEAVLNADLHLDRFVHHGLFADDLNEDLVLLVKGWEELPLHNDSDKVPDRHVPTAVGFEFLFYIAEVERNDRLGLEQRSRRDELLG